MARRRPNRSSEQRGLPNHSAAWLVRARRVKPGSGALASCNNLGLRWSSKASPGPCNAHQNPRLQTSTGERRGAEGSMTGRQALSLIRTRLGAPAACRGKVPRTVHRAVPFAGSRFGTELRSVRASTQPSTGCGGQTTPTTRAPEAQREGASPPAPRNARSHASHGLPEGRRQEGSFARCFDPLVAMLGRAVPSPEGHFAKREQRINRSQCCASIQKGQPSVATVLTKARL